jgi:hypothetical protein
MQQAKRAYAVKETKQQPELLPAKENAATNKATTPRQDSFRPLLEFQELAPSPSQTYYHIAIYPYQPSSSERRDRRKEQPLNRDSIKQGCVVLRDWPRKR